MRGGGERNRGRERYRNRESQERRWERERDIHGGRLYLMAKLINKGENEIKKTHKQRMMIVHSHRD